MTNVFDIQKILEIAEANPNISDIHLSANQAVAFRINGEINRQEDAGVQELKLWRLLLDNY